jgi:Zn-dependent M28 family amino/carboxypeptidase
LLEIAKRVSESPHRPKRSILFLAHTGEEAGLLGSSWYSEHSTVPRDSIVAEMDMDMVGRGSARDLVGGGPEYLELIGSRRQSTQFGDMIDSVNVARAHPFQINYAYDAHDHPEGDWCRADHYSYARFGIPVGAFSTSYHGDYHQVTDEPQYIDYIHLAAIAGFVGDLAVTVANRDHRFVLDHPKPADPHAGCVQ